MISKMRMRKLLSTITLLLAIVSTFYLNSCKKDSFDEEDAMLLQDSIAQSRVRYNLFLTLIDASGNTLVKGDQAQKGVSGASVTFSQNGKLVSKTSDAMGMVAFENVQPGNGAVNIKLDNYSEVNAVLSVSNTSAAGGNQASAIIPMFTVSGTSMTTIRGKVTFESDLTNKTSETVPAGTVVLANVSTSSSAALSGLTSGSIISKISYSGLSGKGVTDASGNYSISVPAASEGLDYSVSVADFTADQILVMYTKSGVQVTGLQTVPTSFGTSFWGNTSSVPNTTYYPIITVSAPVYTYTNATATATINAFGNVNGVTINTPGENYIDGEVEVIFSASQTGTTARGTATVDDGEITNISYTDVWNGETAGSGYTSAPTITINSTIEPETARAIANSSLYFNTYGGLTDIDVFDGGEGYLTEPTVTITPFIAGYGSGATAEAEIDETTSRVNLIDVINAGSNYVIRNISVASGTGTVTVSSSQATSWIRDIYLGTGKRTIEN